jgi:hypothetical protein
MVKTIAFLLTAASFALADTQTPASYSGDFVIKVNYPLPAELNRRATRPMRQKNGRS